MNSWLDKKTYNDARYGAGGFLGHPRLASAQAKGQKHQRPSTLLGGGIFGLGAPGVIFIVFSMLYGARYAEITRADYSEAGHQAFKLAVVQITQAWGDISRNIGISDNGVVTKIVEFLAVMLSLVFAFFSAIGGSIVYIFHALCNN